MAHPAVEYRCASAAELSGWTRRPLAAWLGLRELAELGSWRDTARRAQWLAGRALAKEMLLDRYPLAGGEPTRIEILSRDDQGRSQSPRLWMADQALPWAISIAHTPQAAAVAICTTPGYRVGIDVVASTSRPVVGRWFTPAEQRWLRHTRTDPSLVWAAKEAVYKALAAGEPFVPLAIELIPGASGDWMATYGGHRLGERCSLHAWSASEHTAVLAIVQTSPTALQAHGALPWEAAHVP